jgi:lauroyl/myristoyl acyltransferase
VRPSKSQPGSPNPASPSKRAGSAIASESKPALITGRDLALVATMPVMCAMAWTLSAEAQRRVARALGRQLARVRSGRATDERERGIALLGEAFDHDTLFAASQQNVIAEWLQLLRLQRPGARLPAVSLLGAEHIDAALARGTGAVLWVVRSTYSHTIAKVALHEKGYAVSHLSRLDHGFSPSRFGARVLNPIRTRVERRFLAERVVIGDGAGPALARLAELLRRNRLVSITVGGTASRKNEVPCLGGSIRLSPRPMLLARETGAALLPVVVEALADGTFVTTVFPDLLADDAAGSDAPLRRLGEIIEHYVEKSPDQFAPALLSELL